MKLLIAHNYYRQSGGEDQVFTSEARLLETHGHQVLRYTVHNDAVDQQSGPMLAAKTVWNTTSYVDLRKLIRRERPQIVHFHNTLPLLSPAVYYAAKHEGAAVVQTLHNYRLYCPGALFFRDGAICEKCLHKTMAWPGIVHACYRDSRPASGVVATMLAAHRLMHTWTDTVDRYIALTEFARHKFIEGGLPAKKIVVKPNFMDVDPGRGAGQGAYALFVGRLATEKGIETLLDAWSLLGTRVPLRIVGDGPRATYVAERARTLEDVAWLGRQSREQVLALMKDAFMLIFPSLWYEGHPLTIIEAFAAGLPVVASRLGSMAFMVEHGRTGLHFNPWDPEDLATQVKWALAHPEAVARMRGEARAEFEAHYTAERNYEMLIDIYERTLEEAGTRDKERPPISMPGMVDKVVDG